jgi:integrase
LDTKINRSGILTSNGSKRIHISIIKKYFRSRGIKIHQEDLDDCMTIGRKMKVKKYPLDHAIVSQIIEEMPSFEFKALTILLASTGMRKGEAVTLQPSDFDFMSYPVFIHVRAPDTKGRADRIVYLTKECEEMMVQLINKKPEKQLYLFGKSRRSEQILETFGKALRRILKKIDLYKTLSNGQNQITVHSFRQFFRTYAGYRSTRDFADTFVGHSFYLSEYENMPEEERKKIFLKLEPHMTFLQPKIQKSSKNPEVMELERQLTEIQNKVRILGDRLLA